LAIAFYRCAMASVVLVPLGLARHRDEYVRLSKRQWQLALASGVVLSAHFATWISSLSFTTVAASAVLVQTLPLWVAAFGRFIGERPARRALFGMAIALAGTLVIAGGGFDGGSSVPGTHDVHLPARAGAGLGRRRRAARGTGRGDDPRVDDPGRDPRARDRGGWGDRPRRRLSRDRGRGASGRRGGGRVASRTMPDPPPFVTIDDYEALAREVLPPPIS